MIAILTKFNKTNKIYLKNLFQISKYLTISNRKICDLKGQQKIQFENYVYKYSISVFQKSLFSTNSPKKPLHLMDLPRRLAPNPLDIIWQRLKIGFSMMKLDKSFSLIEFNEGAKQVCIHSVKNNP